MRLRTKAQKIGEKKKKKNKLTSFSELFSINVKFGKRKKKPDVKSIRHAGQSEATMLLNMMRMKGDGLTAAGSRRAIVKAVERLIVELDF